MRRESLLPTVDAGGALGRGEGRREDWGRQLGLESSWRESGQELGLRKGRKVLAGLAWCPPRIGTGGVAGVSAWRAGLL